MISVMPLLTKQKQRSRLAVTMTAASSRLRIWPPSTGASLRRGIALRLPARPGLLARARNAIQPNPVQNQNEGNQAAPNAPKKMQEGARQSRKTLLHELVTRRRIETAAVVYC